MASPAQIAANRRNAQSSTGPATDAGKARIRQNALRHGLCSTIPLMASEIPEEAQLLLDTLREEHQPVGTTEEILVHKMVESLWAGKRAGHLLAEKLDYADQGKGDSREIGLMLRYHTTADRAFYKALAELRKLQEQRRFEEIGFVSQNSQTSSAPPEKLAPQPENQAAPAQNEAAQPENPAAQPENELPRSAEPAPATGGTAQNSPQTPPQTEDLPVDYEKTIAQAQEILKNLLHRAA